MTLGAVDTAQFRPPTATFFRIGSALPRVGSGRLRDQRRRSQGLHIEADKGTEGPRRQNLDRAGERSSRPDVRGSIRLRLTRSGPQATFCRGTVSRRLSLDRRLRNVHQDMARMEAWRRRDNQELRSAFGPRQLRAMLLVSGGEESGSVGVKSYGSFKSVAYHRWPTTRHPRRMHPLQTRIARGDSQECSNCALD